MTDPPDTEIEIAKAQRLRYEMVRMRDQMNHCLVLLEEQLLEHPQEATVAAPLSSDAELTTSFQQLSDRADKLTELLSTKAATADVNRGFKKTGRRILGSYGLWLVDVIMIIVSVVVITGIVHRIENLVHQNCALYGYVLSLYNPATRARSPLGPVAYDNFYRQMQDGADALECGIPHKI